MPPEAIPALEAIVEADRVAVEGGFEQTNRRRNEEKQCIERQRPSRRTHNYKNVRQNVKAVTTMPISTLRAFYTNTAHPVHPNIVTL